MTLFSYTSTSISKLQSPKAYTLSHPEGGERGGVNTKKLLIVENKNNDQKEMKARNR
jgi:hypothetical protein